VKIGCLQSENDRFTGASKPSNPLRSVGVFNRTPVLPVGTPALVPVDRSALAGIRNPSHKLPSPFTVK
jgi:hypothetical protein